MDTTREAIDQAIKRATDAARHLPLSQVIVSSLCSKLRALLTRAEAAEAERDQTSLACKIERRAKEDARAERDALAAKLALAVEALAALMDLNDNGGPFGGELYRDRVDRAWDNARATLAQLTADTPACIDISGHDNLDGVTNNFVYPDPRIEGWNAAIGAAARKVEIHNLGRNKDRADRMLASIRDLPCPYTPKEGKDDE